MESSGKLNTGPSPKRVREMKSAVMEADMVDSSTSVEKSLCSSSRENSTPARGALKAAERPALAPQVSSIRSSVTSRRHRRETPFPAMAPSWMEGPSRPRESPAPMVSSPPTNLASSTRHQVWERWPCSSPSTWGMPEPLIRGSHRSSSVTKAASTSSATSHRGSSQGRPVSSSPKA